MRFQGKVAIVTGGSKGLGKTIAKQLAHEGASVVINGRDMNALEEATQEIRREGGQITAIQADVSKSEDVKAMIDKVIEDYNRIDILINNAAVFAESVRIMDLEEEEWDRVINTNLKGYYLVAQAVVPQMIERGYGKVINMSSIFGAVAMPNQLAYAASKGGINQMTKVMALEWAQKGVCVNAIGPTYFETELVAQLRNDTERFNFINERTPVGRWGYPPELEGIVIFLASQASDFITGQTIYIDGGWTAW